MAKTILILVTTAFFAVVGLLVSCGLIWGVRRPISGFSEFEIVVLAVVAPLIGTLVGLIVGCVGVAVGTKLSQHAGAATKAV